VWTYWSDNDFFEVFYKTAEGGPEGQFGCEGHPDAVATYQERQCLDESCPSPT